MMVSRHYEVNYANGNQLDFYVAYNTFDIRRLMDDVWSDWNRFVIKKSDSGVIRLPVPIINVAQARPEHLWTATYLAARAYAYLNQELTHRPKRLEHFDFLDGLILENNKCRITKLYHDFLYMLSTEQELFAVPCEKRQVDYIVPSSVGVPDIADLPKLMSLLLRMPKQVMYCTGQYVPHLVLDHRAISSYEYASFSKVIFAQEADAILSTLAE